MKTASYIVVVVLALIAVQPVYAGACEPDPVWIRGSGSTELGKEFVVVFDESLQSVDFLIIDSVYSYQILEQNQYGFTAKLLPINADNARIGYYTYYAFGYEAIVCYVVSLPMVTH